MENTARQDNFTACRRCDDCGVRTEIKSDNEEVCILQCSLCKREYPFYKSPREDRMMRENKERSRLGPEYDIIIIGGGPAGLSAGIFAMRAAMRTVLIEKGAPGGQMAINKGVENYPGYMDINGFDLSDKFLQHARAYGLEILREEAVAIEPGPHFHAVKLSNGKTLRSHAVILSPGGVPRTLGIPGEIENLGRGVSYCATCDGFFYGGKAVAVVGGGDTALEEAIYLSKIASEVHLIHRRNDFRASSILQQRLALEPKITVNRNTVVTGIVSNGDGVHAIRLRSGDGVEKDLAVEGIFIFIGFSPDRKLVPAGMAMNPQGYVLTDGKCESSIPGIFVVGDLRQKYANQIIIAAADGSTAALAAAKAVTRKMSGLKAAEAS